MEAQTILMIATPVILLGGIVLLVARLVLGPDEREPLTESGHELPASFTHAPSGVSQQSDPHQEVKTRMDREKKSREQIERIAAEICQQKI